MGNDRTALTARNKLACLDIAARSPAAQSGESALKIAQDMFMWVQREEQSPASIPALRAGEPPVDVLHNIVVGWIAKGLAGNASLGTMTDSVVKALIANAPEAIRALQGARL